MAAAILKGEKKASEYKYETITQPGLYINMTTAESLDIAITDELLERAIDVIY